MANWEQGFYYTMKFEDSGLTGVVTSDSGGTTRFGISQKAHPEAFPDILGDAQDAITIAKRIYRTCYWCGDNLTSQDVANKISDLRFNMGAGTGVRIAQKAAGATVDGVWGPNTEAAVNAVPESVMLDSLRVQAAEHYQNIAANNPSEAKYLRGWMRRATA